MTHAECRKALGTWPDEWRERWGKRSNELAEEGVVWPTYEIQAFAEVQTLKARGGDAGLGPTPAKPSPVPTQKGLF